MFIKLCVYTVASTDILITVYSHCFLKSAFLVLLRLPI